MKETLGTEGGWTLARFDADPGQGGFSNCCQFMNHHESMRSLLLTEIFIVLDISFYAVCKEICSLVLLAHQEISVTAWFRSAWHLLN